MIDIQGMLNQNKQDLEAVTGKIGQLEAALEDAKNIYQRLMGARGVLLEIIRTPEEKPTPEPTPEPTPAVG